MHHTRSVFIALFSAGSFAVASPATAAEQTRCRSLTFFNLARERKCMSKSSVFNVMLFSILVTGCATYQKPDWSQYKGPGKEYFVKEEVQFPEVPDKVEPMNRVLSGFNHGLMTGIVQPFSWVYRSVLPSFARTGIGNAFDNAYYPVRVLSNIFQGKREGAWQETRRFAINTTYGVLGLWDRATEMNIKPVKEDFGQTFGAWGWRNSNFLTIPILGPSTIRDIVGSLADAAFDPLTYFFPATYVRSSTRLGQGYPEYKRFVELNFDSYEWGKLLYVLTVSYELTITSTRRAPMRPVLRRHYTRSS